MNLQQLMTMAPAQQEAQLKAEGYNHGATFTLDHQRYVYLAGEGIKPYSVLSPREKRLFGLTRSRAFVSQKERLKDAPLDAYQALVSGAV